MHLENERLKIEVQPPGTFYSGARFDWTGLVSQVTLDGAVQYCVPERLEEGEGTGGHGFCNEFGLDQPVGYEETVPGKRFPKIGTGLLKKEANTAYDIFYPYEVVPASAQVMKEDDAVIFDVSQESQGGYAYHLTKTVRLDGTRLIQSYTLRNTGQKPLYTNEYSHNFIGLNDTRFNGSYELTIPGLKALDVVVGELAQQGETVTWPVTPTDDVYAGLTVDTNGRERACNWDLYHRGLKAGVRDISPFTPSKLALWGRAHVACPEVFIDLHVEPGETASWERVYEFYREEAE